MSSEQDADRLPSRLDRKGDPEERKGVASDTNTTVVSVPIVRVSSLGGEEIQQAVIQEAPLTIYVNDKQIVTLLTIMHDLQALAVGFLYFEGWITDRSAITEIRTEKDQGIVRISLKDIPPYTENLLEKRIIGSSCGKATSFYSALDAIHCQPVSSSLQVRSSDLAVWMKELLGNTPLYRRTRGTHAVALCGASGFILCEQDIGRHNAVDRILGRCLLEEIPTEETVMLTTGRLSSEMVTKAARLGTPIVVSRSSPTSLALSLADRLRITIVGCVKGARMNIYSHPDRVLWSPH